MDYNRVQSYIKAHVLPKLDSLQTGMDGIPNLLTPSFDSIKNVLASITAKVDNVRGGVDLNHTALTDLQNRLTKVEGSVGKVQQDVGKVQADVGGMKPIAADKIKCIKYNGNSGDVVSVRGAGQLLAVVPRIEGVSVVIDGSEKLQLKFADKKIQGGMYAAKDYVLSVSSSADGGTFAKLSFDVATPFATSAVGKYSDVDGFEATEYYNGKSVVSGIQDSKCFVSIKPIKFEKSLRITATASDASGTVAYTLDE